MEFGKRHPPDALDREDAEARAAWHNLGVGEHGGCAANALADVGDRGSLYLKVLGGSLRSISASLSTVQVRHNPRYRSRGAGHPYIHYNTFSGSSGGILHCRNEFLRLSFERIFSQQTEKMNLGHGHKQRYDRKCNQQLGHRKAAGL